MDRHLPSIRPPGRAIGFQDWRDLLFVHWRIDADLIRPLIPSSLEIDEYDGSAWIGIVAFRMSAVRPWWSPPVPGVSNFPETNVRTYVHCDGSHPGVWFLSLDAASALGVKIGRWKWGLAYHRARMSVDRERELVRYRCERMGTHRAPVGGTLEARVDMSPSPVHAAPGTLDDFLVERYLLYSRKGARTFRGQVYHTPYPLRQARIVRNEQNFFRPLGVDPLGSSDHLTFSDGVSTEIFPLRPVHPGVPMPMHC